MNIADELAVHAKEELTHALKIANHVDYLGGMPSVAPKSVKTSDKADDMLKFDIITILATCRGKQSKLTKKGPKRKMTAALQSHDGVPKEHS